MNHSTIMKASATLSMLFGLALLLVPNELVAAYKAAERLTTPGIYNSMLYGAALIGLAVINWTASNRGVGEAKPVILGTLIGYVLGLIVVLIRQLTDPNISQLAWVNVVIFAVFTALYAYLQLGKARSSASPTAAA